MPRRACYPPAHKARQRLRARRPLAINSTIFLAESELRVDERSGSVTERITRNGDLDDPVTITYGVTGDTAVAGQDFVGGFGTVTMPPGAAAVSVRTQVLGGTAGEGAE